MNYKYAGKDYSLKLDDDGQILCVDLNIKAPTLEETKALIREQAEKEKSLPRMAILTFGDWRSSENRYFEGTSTLKDVGGHYGSQVWITYKDEKGKSCRSKDSVTSVYEDTPENRERLDKYIELQKQIENLKSQASELKSDCTTVTAIKV